MLDSRNKTAKAVISAVKWCLRCPTAFLIPVISESFNSIFALGTGDGSEEGHHLLSSRSSIVS